MTGWTASTANNGAALQLHSFPNMLEHGWQAAIGLTSLSCEHVLDGEAYYHYLYRAQGLLSCGYKNLVSER